MYGHDYPSKESSSACTVSLLAPFSTCARACLVCEWLRDRCVCLHALCSFLMRVEQDADVAHCFKEIGKILNLEEVSSRLPSSVVSVMRQFNGKPVLTRPDHRFHRDPNHRYLACDLDGHRYRYMTRGALAAGLEIAEWCRLAFGFVVEARKEAEMPERMLCCCEIRHMNAAGVVHFPPMTT